MPTTLPTPTLPAEIARFRGTFSNGHTAQDANRVLSAISELLGVELAIIWDFQDFWGCGGNSELLVRDAKRNWREIADDRLYEFLYEGVPSFPLDEFRERFPFGKLRYRRGLDEGEGQDHNYVLKVYRGEAPSCA